MCLKFCPNRSKSQPSFYSKYLCQQYHANQEGLLLYSVMFYPFNPFYYLKNLQIQLFYLLLQECQKA